MVYVMTLGRALVGLVIILVALALLGITPWEAGQWVGEAFGSIGDFFDGIRQQTGS